jgi:outer membrane protein
MGGMDSQQGNRMILFLIGLCSGEPLSYEQALSTARKKNPDIQSAALDVEQSDAGILIAQSILDPQFNASVGQNLSTNQQFFAGFGLFNTEVSGISWSTGLTALLPTGTSMTVDWSSSRSATKYQLQDAPIEQEVNPYDTSLSLNINQPLLEGLLPSYNLRGLREAQSTRSLSQLTQNETEQRILKEVAQAYWELYHCGKLVEIAEQSLRIARDEKRSIVAQIEEGNLPPIEQTRMESAELSAQSSLIDTQNQYTTLKEQLLLLLGKSSSLDIRPISPPPPIEDTIFDEQQIIAQVQQENLSILRLRAGLFLEKERLKHSKHEALPTLNATARFSANGWDESLSSAVDELVNGELPGRYLGLTLNMPISNLAVQGNRKRQQAVLSKAKLELNQLEQSLIQQARAALRNLRSARLKYKLAQTNLKLAQQTSEADRALRDAGRKTQTELLNSIKAVEDAQTSLERAQTDYLLAEIDLRNLMGIPFQSGSTP